MILLIGHLKENNYDGYAPHHHVMLADIGEQDYLDYYHSTGKIYPDARFADQLRNPWECWFVRRLCFQSGYGYREPVKAAHQGLYAFPQAHDGLDIHPLTCWPGNKIADLNSRYTNINGCTSSARVFALQEGDVLGALRYAQGGEVWVELAGELRRGISLDGASYARITDLALAFGKRASWIDDKRTVQVR